MFKIISRSRISKVFTIHRNLASVIENEITESNKIIPASSDTTSTIENIPNEETLVKKAKAPQRIELSEVSKYLRPGALSSMYVDNSDILQQLLKLGVEFYKIEKNPKAFKFILTLKFDDIREHIQFLNGIGIEKDIIGKIISRNPFILREDLQDLEVRINYLKYKKFTDEMVVRLVGNNAHWLSYSTQEIDERLGFFQHNFGLKGNEVRTLATKCPKLITTPLDNVKVNSFMMKEEMGFTPAEIKKVIMEQPELLMYNRDKVLKTFDYLHNTMSIPLERIMQEPNILTFRQRRVMERHLFLVKLNRAQYNPKEPNFVGLRTLASGTDAYFSTEVAKCSVQMYNTFLKSL